MSHCLGLGIHLVRYQVRDSRFFISSIEISPIQVFGINLGMWTHI